MNVVEIIFSPTGGTEKVAHIIGGHWSKNTVKIDLCDSKIDFTSSILRKTIWFWLQCLHSEDVLPLWQ